MIDLNIYAYIILGTLVVEFVLEIISEKLNLSALGTTLPEEFVGVFDEEKYKKSQKYTRVTTRFGQITGGFDLILMLVFWFMGGFEDLNRYVLNFGFGTIASGLIFIGILMLGKTILSLPFLIYSTFVIEERFGFNKTTPGLFVKDMLKGLLLSIVIGAPILAAVLWFFISRGSMAWLYCWGFVTLVTLILQYIAPTWIMPLFNKFTPLEEGELKIKILEYAKSVDFSLSGLFMMDGSKRSAKSNAFFTGFGKNKRIALFDTLIEKQTTEELVAVLAHEIGHYKKKHIIKSMIISIAHTGAMLYLLGLFLTTTGLYEAFYMTGTPIYAGFIFFGMLFAPFEMLLSIAMNIFSRKNEYEADRFSAETTKDSESLILALKKLSADNLSNLTPHPFYVFLNYSHPPVLTRILALRQK